MTQGSPARLRDNNQSEFFLQRLVFQSWGRVYISEIQAEGFRCFSAEAPLCLRLQRGLNVLVGPNDAGKTAIIDAPRYVLWTRGDDYVRKHAHQPDARVDKLVECQHSETLSSETNKKSVREAPPLSFCLRKTVSSTCRPARPWVLILCWSPVMNCRYALFVKQPGMDNFPFVAPPRLEI